jgi:hypothetical protein
MEPMRRALGSRFYETRLDTRWPAARYIGDPEERRTLGGFRVFEQLAFKRIKGICRGEESKASAIADDDAGLHRDTN